MEGKPMFVFDKSGVIITPEAFDSLRVCTRYFIHEGRATLDVYQYRVPDSHEEETQVVNMQREMALATALLPELEEAGQVARRMFQWHFKREAEVWRRTCIQLGLQRIQDNAALYAALCNQMAMLKEENPFFSPEKFISYIDERGIAY